MSFELPVTGTDPKVATKGDLETNINDELALKAPKANPTFTGTVSGVTKAHVGLGNVNNTADADKPISDATQSALNAKAPIANPTFTGAVSGVTKAHVGLGNVNNTADADKPISGATQVALNAKAPTANPTFTGTVSGVTKAHVGLGNVNNTADTDKPISNATQSALDDRAGKIYAEDTFDALAALTARARDSYTGDYTFSFMDRDGYVVAGIVGDAWAANSFRLTGIEPLRAAPPYLFSIEDTDESAAFGVRPNGRVHIPSLEVGYLESSVFSETIPVANVRRDTDFLHATRNDTAAYDVRRKATGSEAVIVHNDPMMFLPVVGQSNAGGQGPLSGELYEGNAFPQIVVAFSGMRYLHGETLEDEGDLTDLSPITDAGLNNQFPVNVTAQALEYVTRELEFTTTPGIFAVTIYEGGEPVSSFEDGADVDGHYNWLHLMMAARASKSVAESYGRAIDCPAIVWVQGESGPSTGYAAAMQALAADMTDAVKTEMGLSIAPKFLVCQINSTDSSNSQIDVALDQIASHGVGNILVAGPMYQCPLQDEIHTDPIGKKIHADMLADVIRVLRSTGDWTPLMMTGAVLDGAEVTITFDVPADAIQFDDDWVKAVSNQGFSYVDDNGAATVSDVQITGPDEVTLTLAAPPTGDNPVVRYAVWGAETDDGWATGRGALYSPTRTPSLYYKLGYDVPSHARHYAVRQQIGVS